MNILVYGAGVIGSVYAARLQEAGHNVSLLARGQRAVSLREHGIQLEDGLSGRRSVTRVAIVEQLAPEDSYDVVIITVRLDHLDSILPILAANHQIPTLLFLLNNPGGMKQFEQLDPQRVLPGFPCAGGSREGDVVRYIVSRQIPMVLGEADGRVTPRARQMAAILKQAGFPVSISPDIQTWLKTHAIMVGSIISTVAMTGGKSAQLSRSRRNLMMMVQAIREGFLALQAQGTPLTPFSMTLLFLWLPRWLIVSLLQAMLRTPVSKLGIDDHLDDDIKEVQQMAQELMAQLRTSPRATPTLNHLFEHLNG
ncbi:2-dehydropantoate 2-reductase [Reticulibacter mediterranei]|uniref:2-dehydropantoate 2-reductase n=1 Tax=Reticulibacter mediterranei TaxID=2778369 RepID=A0A8J3IU99_9CHLR|nr:2-dehydropantoate 2-reductase N-terminal domain-containing protein [Reticulibacter mediterranei]GHO97999.1 2-dehydropantoate 2-reductase [Reticulibacter mediterranei]